MVPAEYSSPTTVIAAAANEASVSFAPIALPDRLALQSACGWPGTMAWTSHTGTAAVPRESAPAPVGHLAVYEDGVIREISTTAAYLLGRDRLDVLGYPLVMYAQPQCRAALRDHLRKAFAGQTDTVQLAFWRPEGKPFLARLYSQGPSGPPGPNRYCVCTLIDLSGQVALRRRFQAQQRELAATRDRIAELQGICRSLERRIAAHAEALEQSEDRAVELEQELEDRTLELARTRNELERLTEQQRTLQAHVAEQQAQWQARVEKQAAELESLREKLRRQDARPTNGAEQTRRIERLNRALAARRQRCRRLERVLAAERQRLTEVTAEHERRVARLADVLEQQRAERQRLLDDLEARMADPSEGTSDAAAGPRDAMGTTDVPSMPSLMPSAVEPGAEDHGRQSVPAADRARRLADDAEAAARRARLEEIQRTEAALLRRVEVFRRYVRFRTQRLNETADRLQRLQSRYERLRRRMRSRARHVQQALQVQTQRLTRMRRRLVERMTTYRQTIEGLREQVVALHRDIEQIKAWRQDRLAALVEQDRALRHEHARLQQAHEALTLRAAQLRQTVDRQADRLARVEAELEKRRQQAAAADQALRGENERLTGELAAVRAELEAARRCVAETNARHRRLEEQYEQQTTALSERLERAERAMADARRQAQENQTQVRALEKELADRQESDNLQRRRLEEYRDLLETLRQRLAEQQQVRRQLQNQHQDLADQVAGLTQQVTDLTERLADVTRRYQADRQRFAHQIVYHKQTEQRLFEQRQQLQGALAAAKRRIQELEQSARQSGDHAEQRRQLERQVERLQAALREAQTQVEAADRRTREATERAEAAEQQAAEAIRQAEVTSQAAPAPQAPPGDMDMAALLAERTADLENVLAVVGGTLPEPLAALAESVDELEVVCRRRGAYEAKDVVASARQALTHVEAGIAAVQQLFDVQIEEADELNVNLIVEDILAEHGQWRQTGVTFRVDTLPTCAGDALQVKRLFEVLLDNAVRYRKNGRDDCVWIDGRQEGDTTVYCIEDNGRGMVPAHVDRAFAMFSQLESQGPDPRSGRQAAMTPAPSPADGQPRGIGLAVAKRIVATHGGHITVQTEPGIGSKIFVHLPRGLADLRRHLDGC